MQYKLVIISGILFAWYTLFTYRVWISFCLLSSMQQSGIIYIQIPPDITSQFYLEW
jgi:hypothetical protein